MRGAAGWFFSLALMLFLADLVLDRRDDGNSPAETGDTAYSQEGGNGTPPPPTPAP